MLNLRGGEGHRDIGADGFAAAKSARNVDGNHARRWTQGVDLANPFERSSTRGSGEAGSQDRVDHNGRREANRLGVLNVDFLQFEDTTAQQAGDDAAVAAVVALPAHDEHALTGQRRKFTLDEVRNAAPG